MKIYSYNLSKEDIIMANKKSKIINKTAGFSAAAQNTKNKEIADRPYLIVRAMRWLFVRMPRAVWRWLCNIEINGLCSLTLMLMIIILFSFLIGQMLSPRYDDKNTEAVIVTNTPEITKNDNVRILNNSFTDEIVANNNIVIKTEYKNKPMFVPRKKTTIILPLKQPVKTSISKPEFIKINGNIIIDGTQIGKRLGNHTRINGNLVLQNMRGFTLPCGIRINGNLIIRNVNSLNFCGDFTVNGDIYVSSNSSFGPIPRNANVMGQVIF